MDNSAQLEYQDKSLSDNGDYNYKNSDDDIFEEDFDPEFEPELEMEDEQDVYLNEEKETVSNLDSFHASKNQGNITSSSISEHNIVNLNMVNEKVNLLVFF